MANSELSHRFIDRPILAGVLSVFIFIAGLISLFQLPIGEYPEVSPPQVNVAATYPGANPKVIAETVAAPLEEQINGVENMLYMSSKSTTDGAMQITVTFKIGTDPDLAQQLVQNRVSQALPRLPDIVRALGVTTVKSSPDLTMVVHMTSPDGRYDSTYLHNYALLNISDKLARLPGIGRVGLFGGGDYAMRVWLHPPKMAARGITAPDVANAIREQNAQVAGGTIGATPMDEGVPFELPVNVQGRLKSVEDFENIVVKADKNGAVTKLKDIARLELGAASFSPRSLLNNENAVGIPIFQTPDANALDVSDIVRETMKELKKNFPAGVDYTIVYDPTVFVRESIKAVVHTLIEALLLVVLVVIVFLQTWRASVIPLLAVPVSIIGTFAAMHVLGVSINTLSLFGLVLAIGIVVDDAIVVVENVERNIQNGLAPRAATYQAMREVSGPIIAIALVLCAVFVPIAFISGLTGQFYKQFALTIAISTVISAFNSLTLSPGLAAILLRDHHAPKDRFTLMLEGAAGGIFRNLRRPLIGLIIFLAGKLLIMLIMKIALFFGHPLQGPPPTIVMILSMLVPTVALLVAASISFWFTLAAICHLVAKFSGFIPVLKTMPWLHGTLEHAALALFIIGLVVGLLRMRRGSAAEGFSRFNNFFHRLSEGYHSRVERLMRHKARMIGVYIVLLALTGVLFSVVARGYVPYSDKQYLIALAQLPSGSSLERTTKVIEKMTEIVKQQPGVANAVAFPGLSAATFANSPNAGTVFVTLKSFDERMSPELSAGALSGTLNGKFVGLGEALVQVFPAPTVRGLGTLGGFKLQLEDTAGLGYDALKGAIDAVSGKACTLPEFPCTRGPSVFSFFRNDVPQLQVDVNRVRVKQQDIALTDVFNTLQMFLGNYYVNDFNLFGKTFRVYTEADAPFRAQPEDINQLKLRNGDGQMVPLGSIVNVSRTYGVDNASRYNGFPSADITGNPPPGVSSGQAQTAITKLLQEVLPKGVTFEWTDLTYQQILAGNSSLYVFPLCVFFVFLVLAAQYESLGLPLAVILIVPMCLFGAIFGVWLSGHENNIFTQIGFIVLVGLACKNAILIVEFARELEHQGKSIVEAALTACQLRLRPILMTSIAFIMGVIPLITATGPGAEMRRDMGVAVFSGMIGVTFFGLFLTPIFYVVIRTLVTRGKPIVSNIKQLEE